MEEALHLHRVTTYDWLTTAFSIKEMDGSGCHQNCSGHGHCQNGMCVCQVQFAGWSCETANTGYFFAFGTIFICLAMVTFIQLCICIRNDYQRQRGKKSLKAAMSLTAQKLLYIFTIIATIVRGIYFFTKWHISEVVSLNLWSAYYPIVLSGFAFIICLWAEAFHLENIDHDRPGFLSKSVIGFYVFNIFIYTLLCAQLVATDISTDMQFSDMIIRISNSLLALMMIVAVVFFLIYGVEVYFKVRGAFSEPHKHVDTWQLHSSRIGLLAQAVLQLVTALFIVSDVLKDLWKDQLPILNQNFYDIGFRLSEFGIALWFPCVLWNCKRPQDLWVLNPRRLFKSFDFHDNISDTESDSQSIDTNYTQYGSIKTNADVPKLDCWICYDIERNDAGALIQPCQCKGDVASVHHECLRKWLMECAEKEEALKCKVCNKQYKLEESWVWLPRGLKKRHWFQTFMLTGAMVGAPFGAYAVWHSIYVKQTYINILIIGLTILVELVCLRFLGVTFGICLRNGRLSNVTILGRKVLDTGSTNKSQSNSKTKQESSSGSSQNNSTNKYPAKDKPGASDRHFKQGNGVPKQGGNMKEQQLSSDIFSVENARSYSISVEAVIETQSDVIS